MINPELCNIRFNHYGLAVKRLSKAKKFYNNLGYKCSQTVIDPYQKVKLILCKSKNFPNIELLKPLNNESPINNYLKKNNEIIYHTCFEVENIKKDLKYLFSGNRALKVCGPDPTSKLFNIRFASFYYINNVGLIEVLHNK